MEFTTTIKHDIVQTHVSVTFKDSKAYKEEEQGYERGLISDASTHPSTTQSHTRAHQRYVDTPVNNTITHEG